MHDYHMAELDYWQEYKAKIDALHAEMVRLRTPPGCGYVYVFRMIPTVDESRDGSFVLKIGMSRSPETRLKQVRSANVIMPYRIVPFEQYWAEDMSGAERMLHTLLSRYRVDGEWFRIPHEMWESLRGLWYIAGSRSSSFELRDVYSGGYYTPHDFFRYQIELFRNMTAGQSPAS